jgi:hypothetical protein
MEKQKGQRGQKRQKGSNLLPILPSLLFLLPWFHHLTLVQEKSPDIKRRMIHRSSLPYHRAVIFILSGRRNTK